MKKSRFTDSQIIDALKRAEAGLTVPELCRELGIVRQRSTSGGAVWRHGCIAHGTHEGA
ncbi:transposase [Staphylococcus epidermidis]|nr:transposase [Staphylococcus epidermidis]